MQKKHLGFILLLCCVCFCNAQTPFTLHPTVKLETVFDSVLLKNKNLTCNQYYNKIYSDYYKGYKGNKKYVGLKSSSWISTNRRYSKRTPCVMINGRPLELYEDFYTLTQFKKLISFEYQKPIDRCDSTDMDKYGVFYFKAN